MPMIQHYFLSVKDVEKTKPSVRKHFFINEPHKGVLGNGPSKFKFHINIMVGGSIHLL